MADRDAVIDSQLYGGNVDFPGGCVALTEFEEELLGDLDVTFGSAIGLRMVG